ncbi:uncharacterized protein LOC129182761 isoform X2 [Dunckerocampus dactyliophorus]|nr:uncharacterized protein LOC129182761 isoform X2 [Dunckerocampus dactyliophorus]
MTRATVTQLLILMIILVISCLPEFFTINRVTLVCLPHVLCEQDNLMRKTENRRSGDAEVRRKRPCDHPHFTVDEKWCEERDVDGNPTSKPRGVEDTNTSWYMCETQGNAAQLQSNNSHSAVLTEMTVELQLGDAKFLKHTLYGRSNSTNLQLHSPEGEAGERRDDDGHRGASYCCLTVPPTPGTSSHITCFLRLSNHTISITRATGKFQEDEWGGVFRVLWLVLLCVMLLSLTSAFLRHINQKGGCSKKSKVCPLGYGFTGQELKDGRKDTEINILKGRNLHTYESCPMRSGLSPIEEVEADDDVVESVLDGKVDQYVTAC